MDTTKSPSTALMRKPPQARLIQLSYRHLTNPDRQSEYSAAIASNRTGVQGRNHLRISFIGEISR